MSIHSSPEKGCLDHICIQYGKNNWDRDTWKYVLKYHVTLPQEYIDHVMSEEGAAFIEHFIDQSDSWTGTIKKWKKRQGFLCLLPDNAGHDEGKNIYVYVLQNGKENKSITSDDFDVNTPFYILMIDDDFSCDIITEEARIAARIYLPEFD